MKPVILAACAMLAAASPTRTPAAERTPSPACATLLQGEEARSVSCAIDPSDNRRTYRFTVRFAGSHDDTALSLDIRLDEKPVACLPGSVVTSAGEDGEIDLHCDFDAPAGAARRQLVVQIGHRHAQVVGAELSIR